MGVLLVLTLLMLLLPLPVQLASGVFALATLVLGARTLGLALRDGVRTAVVAAMGAAVGLSAFLLLSTVSVLATWPAQPDYQECLRLAVTTSAREECRDQLERDLEEQVERIAPPWAPRTDG